MAEPSELLEKYVAFAFAASDVLLEVDRTGQVCFATGGVTSLLEYSTDEIQSKSLPALANRTDGATISETIYRIAGAGKVRDVPVALKQKFGEYCNLFLSGIQHPSNQDRVLLALRAFPISCQTVDEPSLGGIVDQEMFADQLNDGLLSPSQNVSDYSLGLYELPMPELMGANNPRQLKAIVAEVEACLSVWSAGDSPVGRVADGRYGLLLDESVDPVQIATRVSEIIDAENLGVEVSYNVLGMDGDIDKDQLRGLISHVVDDFKANGCNEDGLGQLLDFRDPMVASQRRPMDRPAMGGLMLKRQQRNDDE